MIENFFSFDWLSFNWSINIGNFFISEWWIGFILFFALFAKSLWFFYYFGLYAFERKPYK